MRMHVQKARGYNGAWGRVEAAREVWGVWNPRCTWWDGGREQLTVVNLSREKGMTRCGRSSLSITGGPFLNCTSPAQECAVSLPHQYLSCLHHSFWHNLKLPHWDWRNSEGSYRAMPLTAGFSPSCVTQLVPEPYPTSVEQAAWQPPMGLSCLSTYIHARWWI